MKVILLSIIFFLIILFSIQNSSAFISNYDYLIYQDSNGVHALNGNTGKIDYNGTTSYVINNSIQSLQNGGLIQIKNGVYWIDSTILINKNGVVIEGQTIGNGFSINPGEGVEFVPTSLNTEMLKINSNNDRVSNIIFLCQNSVNVAIHIVDTRFSIFSNLSINRPLQEGILLQGINSLTANNIFNNIQIFMPNDFGVQQNKIEGIVLNGTSSNSPVTANEFYNVIVNIKPTNISYGLDFVSWCDNNVFFQLTTGSTNTTAIKSGIIFNTGKPSQFNGVYSEYIYYLSSQNGNNPQAIINNADVHIFGVDYKINGKPYFLVQNNGTLHYFD